MQTRPKSKAADQAPTGRKGRPGGAAQAVAMGKRLNGRAMIAMALIGAVYAASALHSLFVNDRIADLAATTRAYSAVETAALRVDEAARDAAKAEGDADLPLRRMAFAALKLDDAMREAMRLTARLGDSFPQELAEAALFAPFADDPMAHLRDFAEEVRDPEWRDPARRPVLALHMQMNRRAFASSAHRAAMDFIEAQSRQQMQALNNGLWLGASAMGVTLFGVAWLIVRPAVRGARRTVTHLNAAKTEALRASRMKTEFLSIISHELRTPLNGVLGMSALIERDPMTERQSRATALIRESGQALLRMINDILEYTLLAADKPVTEHEMTDLSEPVARALDALRGAARRKGIALWLRIDPELPDRIACDPDHLEDMLRRLIDNAVKFTQHGHVGVEITGREENGECDFAISVHDTGPGVPPERRGEIFDHFTQIDGSETRINGGGGLGLAIAARRAHACGLSLTCGVAIHGGAAFTLRKTARCANAPGHCAVAQGAALLLHPQAQARGALEERLNTLGLRCVAAGAPAALKPVEGTLAALLAVSDAPSPELITLCGDLHAAGVALILLKLSPEARLPVPVVASIDDTPSRGELRAALEQAQAGESEAMARPTRIGSA